VGINGRFLDAISVFYCPTSYHCLIELATMQDDYHHLDTIC
jgi:hypothetical protein